MVDDGEEATQTVKLSYRGVDYEVDLSERNAAALDDALAPYLDAGRPVTAARSSRARATKSGGNAPSPNDVRTWAKSHGIKVADRGRLSADVTHRYRQAHRG
jgi:hypothetical protein